MDRRWRKKEGTGENCIMGSFLWYVLLTKCYMGDQITRQAKFVLRNIEAVHVTTVAVDKQQVLHILSVCL